MTSAVVVDSLSKRYRIGGAQELDYKTVRDAFSSLWKRKTATTLPRTFWALRDVSFDVKEGEAIGIIGKNGAGKSTLLKILSRITEPTSGVARLRGRVASLLEVGTGFHPELTGRENIFLNGAILGMSRAEVKKNFDAIVSFSEVAAFLDTPVKRYSSGMYVRLAFAVAAHLDPEILIVDEVLAVGDVGFQRKCLEKMGEESREGRTVLFVSHNMSAIRTLCQTAVWIDGGRVRKVGPSEAVAETYLASQADKSAHAGIPEQIRMLPADPIFRLLDAAVIQQGERTTSVVNGKPIVLEMSYEVSAETYGLHVYVRLIDSDGALLLESLHNGDQDDAPVVRAGRFMSRVEIPADLLVPGIYNLEFNAGTMGGRFLMASPVTVVLTVDAAGRVNRAYTGYGVRGKIAPLLHWETLSLEPGRPESDGVASEHLEIRAGH